MDNVLDLKGGFLRWAEQADVKPADFAKRVGYSYNHAYQLLRGEMPVAVETLGRVVLGYGAEAANQIVGLSSAEDSSDNCD